MKKKTINEYIKPVKSEIPGTKNSNHSCDSPVSRLDHLMIWLVYNLKQE